MNILYSASGVLTLLFIVLLLSKKQKSLADYILAAWFCLISLVIFTTYVNYNELEAWQGLFELTDSSVFLHGPLIWFYTLALTGEDFRFRKKDVWHVLPFFICAGYLLLPLWNGETVSGTERNFILVIKMLHLFAYGMAILLRLKKHERKIADYFSYTEKIELNWLKLLVSSLIVIWIISVVSQLLYAFGEVAIPQYGGFFTNVAVSIFVLVIGYFGIRQTTIFTPARFLENVGREKNRQENNGADKKKESPAPDLPPGQAVFHKNYEQLLLFMENEKPYLDGNLTLYDLAARMQLSANLLSQIINRQSGKSFFDFVNEYRVEEVKRRIRDEEAHRSQTLLAIALDCGFNSKASFNRVFKKMTGLTPSEFTVRME